MRAFRLSTQIATVSSSHETHESCAWSAHLLTFRPSLTRRDPPDAKRRPSNCPMVRDATMIGSNVLHDGNVPLTIPIAMPVVPCTGPFNWYPATSRMPLSPLPLVPAGTGGWQDWQQGTLLPHAPAVCTPHVAGNGHGSRNGWLDEGDNHITQQRRGSRKGRQQRVVSRLHPVATEPDLMYMPMGMALADALADCLVPSSPSAAPSKARVRKSSPSPYESKTGPSDVCQLSRYSTTAIETAHSLLSLAGVKVQEKRKR